MQLVFCCDSADTRQPDDAYQPEVVAADGLHIPYSLVSFEALVNEQDATKAVRRVPQHDPLVLGVYRGWMLRPEQYGRLHAALLGRGLRLINDPAAYLHCHYL